MEELLIEQRFTYINLDKEKGDYYLNILLNTKELQDSITSCEKGKMIQLKLENKQEEIIFSSVLEYGSEGRVYTGEIISRNNKIYVIGLINRFENVKEEEKNYEVYDTFTINKKNTIRNTMYQYNKSNYNSKINLLSNEDVYKYKQSFIKS